MCRYCKTPNKTIVTNILGVSAFVGAGRLLLRFYDKVLDKTIVSTGKIKYCPMCGHKFEESKK